MVNHTDKGTSHGWYYTEHRQTCSQINNATWWQVLSSAINTWYRTGKCDKEGLEDRGCTLDGMVREGKGSQLRFHLQCRRLGFDSWVRKIPWRRKWQLTPVFLPGKSHGQRSLGGYSPRCRKSWTWLKRLPLGLALALDLHGTERLNHHHHLGGNRLSWEPHSEKSCKDGWGWVPGSEDRRLKSSEAGRSWAWWGQKAARAPGLRWTEEQWQERRWVKNTGTFGRGFVSESKGLGLQVHEVFEAALRKPSVS